VTVLAFCDYCFGSIEPDDECPHGPDGHWAHVGCCPDRQNGTAATSFSTEKERPAGEVVDLLHADPHRFGPGKTHIWDYQEAKTLCGRSLVKCPGEVEAAGRVGAVTCDLCIRSRRVAERRERERVEAEAQAADARRRWDADRHDREAERERWWAWYDAYLASAEWKARRALVLKRAGGVCEGCGKAPATIAHHTTYEHVGNELLFELRAVCRDCHDRIHPDKAGGA